MAAEHLIRFARQRLRWLLAFALLLPLAQGIAAAHQLSHAQEVRASVSEALGGTACGACVLAGALVAGGAAPAVHNLDAPRPDGFATPAFICLPYRASPVAAALARGPPLLLA